MTITTEQELIDIFYPDDNTKTINDVIEYLSDTCGFSINEVKAELKLKFETITDWSF